MKSFKILKAKTVFAHVLAIAIVGHVIGGCKKELPASTTISVPQTEIINNPIPPYLFDWETATYMPSPSTSNQILMPWSSGTTAIDANIVGDYRKINGWELVYNTFSPTKSLNDPSHAYFFTLYNRYRGLLRFYLWQQSTPIATSYVNHGLDIYGGPSSPMNNFQGNELIDYSDLQLRHNQILNQQLNASGGTWLVFQYEIAYDQNIPQRSFPNFGLTWRSDWANLSTITLNGTQTGSIQGYIGNLGPSGAGVPVIPSSLLSKGVTTIFGSIGTSAFQSLLNGTAFSSSSYTKAFQKGALGIVEGFLNGILGGVSSPAPQPVTLSLNTSIQLQGQMVNNGGLVNNKLVLPGQLNSQTANGYTPGYDKPMGVFYISGKPTVNAFIEGYQSGPYEDPYDGSFRISDWSEYSYTIDPTSYSLVWNPNVINSSATGATIQNLKTQVIHVMKYGPTFGTLPFPKSGGENSSPCNPQLIDNYFSTIEQVGGWNVATGLPNSNVPLKIDFSWSPCQIDPGVTGIRVSFDVVPNDGSPKTTIVKSFLANVQ